MKPEIRWSIRAFFILYLCFLMFFVTDYYSFLLLNTFLGYIPIEIAFHINSNKIKHGFVFWILIIAWLLFFPNAPYMLTDLVHLTLLHAYDLNTGLLKANLTIWVHFTYLLISTLATTILGFWSMDHVINQIIARYRLTFKRSKFLFASGIILLSSIGIYIGRFLRIHTFYLITPMWIIKPILTMWTPQMLGFVGLLFIVQAGCYICLLIFRNNQ